MKRSLFLTAAVLSCLWLTAGCDIFEIPQTDSEIPENVGFYTYANLFFYFVDENGDDLITFEDKSTWPLTFPRKAGEEERAMAFESMSATTREVGTVYLYNGESNSLVQDAELSLWRFQTFFWGRTKETEYNTYLYMHGDVDSLTVSYRYLTAAETQAVGGSWAVNIESVKYNGVEIADGNENGKVFVQKPSQGGTIVKVGSL